MILIAKNADKAKIVRIFGTCENILLYLCKNTYNGL